MISRLKAKVAKINNTAKADKEKHKAIQHLLQAAENGDAKQALIVLEKYGQDKEVVNAQLNDNGPTALILATRFGDMNIVNALLKLPCLQINISDSTEPEQHRASRNNIFHKIVPDYYGNTALHEALVRKHLDIVKKLIEHTQLDVTLCNKNGKTALACAVEYCPEAISILLNAHPFDVNCVDINGRTALHSACLRHNPYQETAPQYLMTLLAVEDIDLDIQDTQGYTALMYAGKRKDVGIFKALLKAGADATLTNNAGQTVLDMVSEDGYLAQLVTKSIASRARKPN